MNRPLSILVLLMCSLCAYAQDTQDSVKIYFGQGEANLEINIDNNRVVLERLDNTLQVICKDSAFYRLYKVEIEGASSPEGGVELNRRLSDKRAHILLEQLTQYQQLPDSMITIRSLGRDWEGLLHLVRADENIPHKEATVELLEALLSQENPNVTDSGIDAFWQLVTLADGVPYRYMYYNLFPELRATTLRLWYRRETEKMKAKVAQIPLSQHCTPEVTTVDTLDIPRIEPQQQPLEFNFALKTNGLYDLLAVPNIGAEFGIGRHWSITANWMYAWWNNDNTHWYWRIYGGDIGARYWFGSQADEKALTGHHVGVYGQLLTYDIAFAGRGQIGGRPGGSLWDEYNYIAGIEYGYSLPIAPRLNLDFVIGLGHMGGQYHEYKLIDDCYVWQVTKSRNYWGPTKAEISLVWTLGKTKPSKKKGGGL